LNGSDLVEVSADGKMLKRKTLVTLSGPPRERSIFVKGFPKEMDVTVEDMIVLFSQFGRVLSVRLLRSQNRQFKGSVFVEFSNEGEAKGALDKKEIMWKAVKLVILQSVTKTKLNPLAVAMKGFKEKDLLCLCNNCNSVVCHSGNLRIQARTHIVFKRALNQVETITLKPHPNPSVLEFKPFKLYCTKCDHPLGVVIKQKGREQGFLKASEVQFFLAHKAFNAIEWKLFKEHKQKQHQKKGDLKSRMKK